MADVAKGLFLSNQHPGSRRWAIVEDDGQSCWLYLTRPDSTDVVAHCWLYNRIAAPAGRVFGRGDTPIVPAGYVIDPAPFPPADEDSVEFRWTAGGDGVAVLIDAVPMGCILQPGGAGCSRNLSQSSRFYGSPLDADAYARAFGGN